MNGSGAIQFAEMVWIENYYRDYPTPNRIPSYDCYTYDPAALHSEEDTRHGR